MLMTHTYRDEVVSAAQLAGARVMKDSFFPIWQLNQFNKKGLVSVVPAPKKGYNVTVAHPDTGESSTVFVDVPTARKV